MAVIDAPKLPPLLFNKNGRYTYVCTYKNKWDTQLKRAVRVKGQNITVGKIVDGGLTGIIQWSEDFLEQYPVLKELQTKRCIDDKASKGSRVKYYLEFSQAVRDEMEDKMLYVKKASSVHVLHAGATWLLDNIVASTPLTKALYATFSRYYAAQKLLSLAYFKVLEPSKAMYLYEDFAQTTRLPYHRPLNIGSITKLLQHIDDDSIDHFLKKLNKFTQETEDSNQKNIYYALDSTSISTYAKDLSYAEWGHNKDGDTLKQINVVFLVNQRTGCPLYYRVFSGSTPDVSTVSHLLKEYARLDLNRMAIMVADRGYGSVKNIHKLYQCNQSFIINLKTCFSICKNLIVQNLNYLLDPCNYNIAISQSVYTEKIMWSYPGNYNSDTVRCKREKDQMYVHIYLNHDIRNEAEDFFRDKIAQLLALKASDPQSLGTEETEFLNTYTTTDSNGNTVINNTKKFEYMLNKGIRVLVSDIVSDPVEAHRAYQERNEVEMSFRKLKDFTGARRLNISSSKTLRGKMFVHFISCAILCMLRNRINACKDKGITLPYDSDVKMLAALSNITQTVFSDGGYFSEVIGKKKQLLECLSIPMPEAEMNISYEEDESVEPPED
ncbi:IS1634 family transposase [Anaerobiospirillum thomasii]|uniref:Transposase n=1 Tax=Anaerobiospirillum thomasii TaxID=179995 RepID=A0A2X0VA74_9GAMM|nr:transposase [Anaerobiospirillum thomasii]SPT70673.1 Transposase [Anaerobiospirillum thomasii]